MVLLSAGIFIFGCREQKPEELNIRLGWSTARVPLEQIVYVLIEKQVAEQFAFSLNLTGIHKTDSVSEYPGQSEIDVFFAGEIEAAQVLSHSSNWQIISRIAYHRIPVCVPSDSPIQTIEDLDGERVALIPNGLEHRHLNGLLTEKGLQPDRDVRIVDRDETEIRELAARKSRREWGRIDALMSAEAKLVSREVDGALRCVQSAREVIVVLASKHFLETHANRIPDFVIALMESHLYLARHREEASNWTLKNTVVRLDDKAFKVASAVEPNTRAMMKGHVSLHLSQTDWEALQATADFLAEKDLLEKSVDILSRIDVSYLRQAEEIWWAEKDDYPMMQKK
jgi:ABC-type nitrate/sulfonate/bicarbonate transport system substrate-binding protein